MVKSSLNAHTLLLLSYAILVVGVSFIQDLALLILCLSTSFLLSILLSAKTFWSLLQQTLYSIVWFTLTISLGYVVMTWLQNTQDWDTLLRLNLRVLLLTFMTFMLIHYVNFFKALSFSSKLTSLMVIVQSQISVFQRSKEQFQQALMSRSIERPSLQDRYRMTTATVVWLFDKAFFASKEIALALKSRGFFHD